MNATNQKVVLKQIDLREGGRRQRRAVALFAMN